MRSAAAAARSAFGHARGEPQRGDEAVGPRLAGAGDVEGGAVIGRGADEGQAERDVDALVESQRLQRDQRLIVIHGDGGVVSLARAGMETACRPDAGRSPRIALLAQRGQGRRDDGLFLVAHDAAFARMRVEARSRARRGRAMPNQRVRPAAVTRAVSTMRSAVSSTGTRASGIWMVTGTTRRSGPHSIITGEASRPMLARQRAEIFGVAGMREAGRGQHVLGDGIGDHRPRLAAHRETHGRFDAGVDRGRGGRGRLSGLDAARAAAPAAPAALRRNRRAASAISAMAASGHIQAQHRRAPAEMLEIAEQRKGRKLVVDAPAASSQRDVRARFRPDRPPSARSACGIGRAAGHSQPLLGYFSSARSFISFRWRRE